MSNHTSASAPRGFKRGAGRWVRSASKLPSVPQNVPVSKNVPVLQYDHVKDIKESYAVAAIATEAEIQGHRDADIVSFLCYIPTPAETEANLKRLDHMDLLNGVNDLMTTARSGNITGKLSEEELSEARNGIFLIGLGASLSDVTKMLSPPSW